MDFSEDREAGQLQISKLSRYELLDRIEDAVLAIIDGINQEASPAYTFASRKRWDNITVTENNVYAYIDNPWLSKIDLCSIKTMKTFAMMTKVLAITHQLLDLNIHVTKRDVYYQHVTLFECQKNSDEAIENVAIMLQVPRNSLQIIASNKGSIAGCITYKEKDRIVDCYSCGIEGIAITPFVEDISDIQTTAEYVLVIEKDTTFMRLINDEYHIRNKCILVTGKGQPDVATRLMVKKLSLLDIPIYAIVDADPYGIEILSVYTHGSRGMGYDSENLCVPSIRWVGIHITDLVEYRIPLNCTIPLTANDIKHAKELLERPAFQLNSNWRDQIEIMLNLGVKAEIQCLCYHSLEYLGQVYLPSKIDLKRFL